MGMKRIAMVRDPRGKAGGMAGIMVDRALSHFCHSGGQEIARAAS
jgi:hypothetical protein